jgi:hypothetical protein
MTTRAGVKAISWLGSSLAFQQILEQDLQREGQPGDVEFGLEGIESVDLIRPVADRQFGPGVKAVGGHVSNSWFQDGWL